MKVYAHVSRKHNDIVCVATKQYRCTAPFGILDPQPTSPQELHYIRMTGQFTLVDKVEKNPDPTADYVENIEVDDTLQVEVFSLDAPEPADADVDAPLDLPDVKVPDVFTEEPDAPLDASEAVQEAAPSPEATEKYASASDQELRDMCALFDIKVRKNATRATLIKLLTEVDRG